MMQIKGYLICWDDEAQLDTGRERFERNAFVNSRSRLVFAHDRRDGAILGHCIVAQDRYGARFSVQVDEHDRDTRRVICAIRNGLNSTSFKFRPLASRRDGDRVTIERALLLEISVVSDPYYALGGCWLVGDEPYLPPRLALLAEQFATAAPLPAQGAAAHGCPYVAARSSGGRFAPGVANPVQLAARAYMAAYLARAGRGMGCTVTLAARASTDVRMTDCQADSGRESRYVCFPAISAASP